MRYFSPSVEKSQYALADSGFFKNFLYQGGVRSTLFWVLEDLNSVLYEQNVLCFAQLNLSKYTRLEH